MILLWGVPGDSPLDAVTAALQRRSADYVLLDQRRAGDIQLELTVDAAVDGSLTVAGATFELDDIEAMYLRPYDRARLDVTRTASASDRAHGDALDDACYVLAQLLPGTVLNRPDEMTANASKPFQSAQIRAAGFLTPDTMITTSADAALAFLDLHPSVIYKSISGVRSIVGTLDRGEPERLTDLRWCPTQLQQRVPGHDVRVHVVGSQVFACAVRSSAIDYRYAVLSGAGVIHERYELPDDIAQRCLDLSLAVELPLVGIDLRVTPQGEWYCFEANPSPAFIYYEQAVGHPIADAIGDLLHRSSRQIPGG